jgi:hypothetical protein
VDERIDKLKKKQREGETKGYLPKEYGTNCKWHPVFSGIYITPEIRKFLEEEKIPYFAPNGSRFFLHGTLLPEGSG